MDKERIKYVSLHLEAVLKAIWDGGCRVLGYTYWSVIDNFEWMEGFT